jgi:hypothetical protein
VRVCTGTRAENGWAFKELHYVCPKSRMLLKQLHHKYQSLSINDVKVLVMICPTISSSFAAVRAPQFAVCQFRLVATQRPGRAG